MSKTEELKHCRRNATNPVRQHVSTPRYCNSLSTKEIGTASSYFARILSSLKRRVFVNEILNSRNVD